MTRRQCPQNTAYNVVYNVCEYSTTSKCRPFATAQHQTVRNVVAPRNIDQNNNDNFHDNSFHDIHDFGDYQSFRDFDLSMDNFGKMGYDMSNVKNIKYDNKKIAKTPQKKQNAVAKPNKWKSYQSLGVGFPIFIF